MRLLPNTLLARTVLLIGLLLTWPPPLPMLMDMPPVEVGRVSEC